MPRTSRTLGVLSLVILGSCQSATEEPPSVAPPRSSTADGVYTLEQAQRGELVFRSSCRGCHSVSEWTYPTFLGRREGQTVSRFFNLIYETMPPDAPFWFRNTRM